VRERHSRSYQYCTALHWIRILQRYGSAAIGLKDCRLSPSQLLLPLTTTADSAQRASAAPWLGVISTVSIHLMLHYTSHAADMQLIRVPLCLTRTYVAPLADTMCGPPCNLTIALFLRYLLTFTFVRSTSKACRCYATLTCSPSLKFVWLSVATLVYCFTKSHLFGSHMADRNMVMLVRAVQHFCVNFVKRPSNCCDSVT